MSKGLVEALNEVLGTAAVGSLRFVVGSARRG